jgi:hypothetical protein
MHPLVSDLSKLSDDDLFNKNNDLQSKLAFAYRIGNPDMVGQLHLLIQDYREEISRRNQKMLMDAQQASKGDAPDDTAKDITR